MGDTSTALSFMSYYARHHETVALADLYLQPPVKEFGVLQFESSDEIEAIGYEYGKKHVAAWLAMAQ
jgi:hypothetical protein